MTMSNMLNTAHINTNFWTMYLASH